MSQVEEFTEISWRIMRLSQEAKKQGLIVNADRLVDVAADLELLSSDLQMCWGGPLNGQSGRQAIFDQILEVNSFDEILETGTFRGITTEWFAKKYSGPIKSCELEKIYFRQAQSRLSGFQNVHLELMDSREFLTKSLEGVSSEKAVFVYLDAHWKDDLPLARELEIIDGSGVAAIIAIDDFRVPGDQGYQYDDYGPNKSLTIELVEFLKNKGYRLYFPVLPSNLEDEPKRGVCVLTNSMFDGLDACNLLRGGDWRDWRIIELESEKNRLLIETQRHDALLATQDGDGLPAEAVRPVGSVPDDGIDEWLPVSKRFVSGLFPDLDQDALDRVVPEMARLLARHEEFEVLLEQLFARVKRKDEDDRERAEAGRALIEERAHTLKLVRQIHHLRDRLHETGDSNGVPASLESSGRVIRLTPSHSRDVVLQIIKELKNSRGLKMLSYLAPSARSNVLRLESEIKNAM